MDIHRVAAEVVALCDGELARLGRVSMLRDRLEAFARKEPTHDDHVVIEATGNAASVAELPAFFVDRVVIANPKQVRMIAHAKDQDRRHRRGGAGEALRRGLPARGLDA